MIKLFDFGRGSEEGGVGSLFSIRKISELAIEGISVKILI